MTPARRHLSRRRRPALAAVLLGALALPGEPIAAATMYSSKKSFMGAGTFWGPGVVDETPLFDVTIRGIGFSSALNFVTPMRNNGDKPPNICAEREMGGEPRGTLSDGVTRINEAADTCTFELNGVRVLAAVVDGGLHNGRQVAATLDDGTMIMTMDFALDMGIGKSGVIKMPFYGTTGEVTVPSSLQTQLGLPGGVDRAGKLPAGSKLRGRLGDFNHDGLLDGAIVVAGTLPLESIFMPGAPYALIRYFETDIPYDGTTLGRLPRSADAPSAEPPPLTVEPPQGRAEQGLHGAGGKGGR